MSKRTAGRLALDGRGYRRDTTNGGEFVPFYVLEDGKPRWAGDVRLPKNEATHLAACWNAIEAIGGDPATVGELVGTMEDVANALGEVLKANLPGGPYHPYWKIVLQARELLAKVKGN